MKLTFFLIAVFLVLLRIVYPHMDLWHNQRESGTMITKGPDYIEGIWWSGKIRLSNDEQSIAEISPGGHLKYRQQDTLMLAESDLQGKITYSLRKGDEELTLNDDGRRFIAYQIQKMIRLGYFAEDRAKRIYQRGGADALLAELSNMKMEGAREPYLKLLFETDTLKTTQRIHLLQLLDSSDNSSEKQRYLEMFTTRQPMDTAIASTWLHSVDQLNEDYIKKDLLLHFMQQPQPTDRLATVLSITEHMNAENDRQDVYKRLLELPESPIQDSTFAQTWLKAVGQIDAGYMKKDLLSQFLETQLKTRQHPTATQFDTILEITGRFDSEDDQKQILERLIDGQPATNAEWAGLIRATGALQPDYLKSELLLKIAPKMPRTDTLVSAYKASAKKIEGDTEYGKAIRAIE